MLLHPEFASFLSPARLAELRSLTHTVMGLFPDNRVGFRNGAWDSFARANGAPELERWNGTPITETFAPAVRGFYRSLFDRVRDEDRPLEHDYECSSPEHFRLFRLRVLPLQSRALLLEHHLRVEAPHTRTPAPAVESVYRGDDGIITMCCHCRNTRRRDRRSWDWVPAFMEQAPHDLSHGLCPSCFRHYYPSAAESRDRRKATDDPHG